MKKSFLLYTVSGVLFYSSSSLSYALQSATPAPTIDLTSPQSARAESSVDTAKVF
ncbi:hypothetical protein [Bartonella massiliensis]|uniref:hypothetical protein n=1 Tax=Bartonella massiliensis TaxID=929795 RepID=UPI00163BE2EE|nr:hypothetical protein [Bartonella massiliensis]